MTAPTPSAAPPADETGNGTDLAFASQWRLMWLRFKRHRLALAGAGVLLILYIGAAFCEFLAPLTPAQRSARHVRCPPQQKSIP